ncbi:DMT family transporter [Kineosporia sp. J2-2]|uniref:DMT family transporter n=1 Tax=Kineosporia corallincola TaxID=2835133 RepID=A0ABS5TLB1_9ACTN|nr:DMT family transporter [Kineosporia corallincola]MBT0771886.1 DMT family transporter [Kineosporia corallincola]
MNRRATLLFAGLGLAWGIPYMLIKVAGEELAPSVLVLARTGTAALLLVPMTLLSPRDRAALPAVLRRWPAVVGYTVTEVVFPWLFLNRAEQTLPSSTAAILISAVPLAGILIALATHRAEGLGARGGLGLLLGTAGVAALVGLDLSGSDLGAVAEMGVVVLGYAIGPVILARALGDLPGLPVVAVSIALSALIYVPIVLLGPGLPTEVPSARVLGAVAVLAVVCTAAAFLLLFALIGELGPVRATTIVYVNPVIAVIGGALFLGEHLTAWTLLGLALVLAGSYLVNGTPRRAEPVAVREAPSGAVVVH